MAVARYFLDTSAAARMREPIVARRVEPLLMAGLVATCASLNAEALYSARSPAEYEQVRADRRSAYEYVPTDDADWQAALDAQRVLAASGRHRAVGIADLLCARLAARHGLTVVHYDRDFETASEVLAFEHRWVAPVGSIS